MDELLVCLFFLSAAAGIYFFVRLVIRAITGGETSGYKKKLAASVIVAAVSCFMFYFDGIFYDEEDFKEEAEDKLEELLNEHWQERK